ncbi:hypothetical protein C8R45DRAFT_549181 [Mycena sanguinolenta]|nr:hypothetical protein C8R45DRAFT_549181 [Mycena sanguinolenta]
MPSSMRLSRTSPSPVYPMPVDAQLYVLAQLAGRALSSFMPSYLVSSQRKPQGKSSRTARLVISRSSAVTLTLAKSVLLRLHRVLSIVFMKASSVRGSPRVAFPVPCSTSTLVPPAARLRRSGHRASPSVSRCIIHHGSCSSKTFPTAQRVDRRPQSREAGAPKRHHPHILRLLWLGLLKTSASMRAETSTLGDGESSPADGYDLAAGDPASYSIGHRVAGQRKNPENCRLKRIPFSGKMGLSSCA